MSNIVLAIPGTAATTDVAVQTETSAKPKLGSKLLKLNPETQELRERIRAEAFQYVRSIDRSRPLSKKDLEAHAGALLEKTNFGWPLIIGGTLKAAYDLILLVQFRKVATREEGVR